MSMNPNRMESEAKSSSIDELPSEIIDAILVRLPIWEAVRTSILSRQWRYKWTAMTQLEFPEVRVGCADKLIGAVNHVLMLHFGPISKFKVTAQLETSPEIDQQTIDRWMIVLWRNDIKELVLNFYDPYGWGEILYAVHSCIFSCQGLTLLELHGCMLKLPPSFKGFANLVSLYLKDCQVSKDGLQSLISMCPLLQCLVLFWIRGMDCIEIDCPSLEYLSLYLSLNGDMLYDFNLVRTSVLSEVRIDLDDPIAIHHLTQREICNPSKIFACANSIEKLELQRYGLEILAFGSKQEKLPVFFEHLKYLRLSINFCEKQSVSFLLSLLRNSYYLEKLDLRGRYNYVDMVEDKKNLEINEDIDVFNHLKIVKIRELWLIEPEMAFIKFLLVRAPVLQKIEIWKDGFGYWKKGIPNLKDLLRCQRASSQAETHLHLLGYRLQLTLCACRCYLKTYSA